MVDEKEMRGGEKKGRLPRRRWEGKGREVDIIT